MTDANHAGSHIDKALTRPQGDKVGGLETRVGRK
jgi:hypothetical protein